MTHSEEKVEVVKNFQVKNLVVGRGHDGGGLIADVYFKRKKVATFHDDGWGGEPEVRFFSDELENSSKEFLKENNYALLMFNDGWDFMKCPTKIDAQTQFNDVVETLASLKENEKAEKKMKRACKKHIVVGDSHNYTTYGWKGIKSLEELAAIKGGLGALQTAYWKAKKTGLTIQNDLKRLQKLGIEV